MTVGIDSVIVKSEPVLSYRLGKVYIVNPNYTFGNHFEEWNINVGNSLLLLSGTRANGVDTILSRA